MYGIRPTRIDSWPSSIGGDVARAGGRREHVVWLERAQDVVERVALGRLFLRAANEAENLLEGHLLRGMRAGLVIDLFAHHCPLEVVDAKMQRRLRDERRDHDPVRLDVVDVVEK